MNITKAQYYNSILTNKQEGIKATIDGKEVCIPIEPENMHYQAILNWVSKGNTVEAAD